MDATLTRENLLKGRSLYDEKLAFQLDSPTCAQVRGFFRDHAHNLQGCRVFTIYFSGHGGINNGNFFLCPKDYIPEFASLNGISIADLIRYARDLKISVLNIIIDACQSGQSGADLREAIEKPAKENSSSLCISILASSLPDQFSVATDQCSAFTRVLNEFIVGAKESLVTRPILTLADIAQLIPEIHHETGKRQTVIHYSLNVMGPAHFCVNPLMTEARRQPHNVLLSPQSKLGDAVFDSKLLLEEIYTSIPEAFRHRKLTGVIRTICKSASSNLPDLDQLLEHYDDWLGLRSKETTDWSLPLRIAASLSTAAISVGWDADLFMKSRAQAVAKALQTDLGIFRAAVHANSLDPLGLLSSCGVNSFYFAAIRLSHCYARMGLCLLAARIGYLELYEVSRLVARMSEIIEREAPNIHLILNESQASHIGIFFAACSITNHSSVAERPFGRYLSDHGLVKGRVLREKSKSAITMKYLRQRGASPINCDMEDLANPNVTLPMLMVCAKKMGFEELIDPYLINWHKMATSIFIPKYGKSFGDEVMEEGVNVTRVVGVDFYNISHYCSEIESEHESDFERTLFRSDRGFLKCAASYIYPDRFPWPF